MYTNSYRTKSYPKFDRRHHACPVRQDLRFVLVLKNYDYDEHEGRFRLSGEWRVRCRCGHIMPRSYGYRPVRFFLDVHWRGLRYPYAPRRLPTSLHNYARSHDHG